MNEGKYFDFNIEKGVKFDFCIGIVGYLEKYFEVFNMDVDMEFIKVKIDVGVDYIVMQMFFDNQKYFDYVDKCCVNGINVFIVLGLKLMIKKYQFNVLFCIFYIDLFDDFVRGIWDVKDVEVCCQVGIEWCIQQFKEFKVVGVFCLYYYIMGDLKIIQQIVEVVY